MSEERKHGHKDRERKVLPRLDKEPDKWGPDHDDILELTKEEIEAGNRQGRSTKS